LIKFFVFKKVKLELKGKKSFYREINLSISAGKSYFLKQLYTVWLNSWFFFKRGVLGKSEKNIRNFQVNDSVCEKVTKVFKQIVLPIVEATSVTEKKFSYSEFLKALKYVDIDLIGKRFEVIQKCFDRIHDSIKENLNENGGNSTLNPSKRLFNLAKTGQT